MTVIDKIQELISAVGCEVRIKVKNTALASWSKWIAEPTPGYVETFSAGPWPSYEVEWIDINPVAVIHIGRLVKDKQIDHKEKIMAGLAEASISCQSVDEFIRVYLTNSNPVAY